MSPASPVPVTVGSTTLVTSNPFELSDPGASASPAGAGAAFRGGWFRTSDLGRLDAQGRLQLLGRADDVIVSGGINVSPAEVESFLAGHPGVAEVLVVGAPHPTKDEVAVAFVVPTVATVTEEDLIRYCKENIAGYKVPSLVALVDALPHTGTGKLFRRGLRQQAAELVDARLAAGS